MLTKKTQSKHGFIYIASVWLVITLLTAGSFFLKNTAFAADTTPSSLSRSPVVSSSEHPEERLKALRAGGRTAHRAPVNTSGGAMAGAPQWTETIAAPEPPTQAPNPQADPPLWVDPRRN